MRPAAAVCLSRAIAVSSAGGAVGGQDRAAEAKEGWGVESFGLALLLTTGAGLATAIGSVVALMWKEPGPKYMSFTLGFSAGVMIHISFVKLLQEGIEGLGEATGTAKMGFVLAHAAFLGGIALMMLIDVLVSHNYILEEADSSPSDAKQGNGAKGAALRRTSVLVALGIAIHNFPEGAATFMATLKDPSLGVLMAFAIAIHNIPEGIAVAVPIYASTRSRGKAFLWSVLSGVSEPVGALAAALILMPILSPSVLAVMVCVVAGFMVYISFDELLPAARSYGREHLSIVGVLAGILVMAASLTLLE